MQSPDDQPMGESSVRWSVIAVINTRVRQRD
jgi:hypothetical protein